MIYTLPTERLPEWDRDRLIDEIKNATIWYYPLRGKTVEQFRIPGGSRVLGFGNDDQGRQSLRVQIKDALADYETVCITYQFDCKLGETPLRNDKKARYIDSLFVAEYQPYREYFLVYEGHPVVQRGLNW